MFIEVNEIKSFIINIDGFLGLKEWPIFDRSFVWATIDINNIEQVEILPEFIKLIEIIGKNYPFRIVSKLSQSQVEKILSNNSVTIPADSLFVANPENDLEKGIWFFEVIKKARDSMGVLSCCCVYLSADSSTIEAAIKMHLGTMVLRYKTEDLLIEEKIYKSGPDFILEDPKDVEDIISKKFVGYLAEYHSCPYHMRQAISQSHSQLVQFLTIPNIAIPEERILVTGRYFPKDDYRHFKHSLSVRLSNSKNYPERHEKAFAHIIKRSANLVSGNDYDLITCVPPKPSQKENRIKMFLDCIFKTDEAFDKTKVATDILTCVRDYQKQSQAGSYLDRKRNVEGVFRVEKNVAGKKIVVVDDIATSGATLFEITKILRNANCAKVYPVALAFTPSAKIIEKPPDLKCGSCEGYFTPRCERKNGDVFWGCSKYEDGCRSLLKFEKGLLKLNESSSLVQEETGDEIDISF